MAYIPAFEWDIFISYPMEAESWAEQFVTDLRKAPGLAPLKDLQIYFAKVNWELGQISDEMLDQARRSAIFVAILTEGSVSQGESRFLGLEMKAFRESGQLNGRFCPILLFPVTSFQIANLMPLENPQAFWNSNLEFFYKEDGIPLWLRQGSEPRSGDYSKQVEKTSWHLRKRIDALVVKHAAAAEPERKGPFAGKTVLLGQKEQNIGREWNEILELLRNDGVTVASSTGADGTQAGEFESAVKNADLFVQLLSPLDPTDGARSELKTVEEQSRAIPILQWRPQINPRLLERMDADDRHLFEGPHVRAGGFEEFKRAVRDKLKQLAKPPKESIVGQKPYLYITADASDLHHARQIQVAARTKADVDVMAEEESKRAEDFDGGLRQANGIVFLYGNAEPKFVTWWLKQYMRKTRLWRIYPKLTVLFQAPPKKNAEQEPLWGVEELQTYGSQEQFSLDAVEQICAELSRDRA